jgi:hypothetical protein
MIRQQHGNSPIFCDLGDAERHSTGVGVHMNDIGGPIRQEGLHVPGAQRVAGPVDLGRSRDGTQRIALNGHPVVFVRIFATRSRDAGVNSAVAKVTTEGFDVDLRSAGSVWEVRVRKMDDSHVPGKYAFSWR